MKTILNALSTDMHILIQSVYQIFDPELVTLAPVFSIIQSKLTSILHMEPMYHRTNRIQSYHDRNTTSTRVIYVTPKSL
jgi:hypothetical protein